jgi:TRAP-type C4-dicarboxylate transport system substrate-binding protein
MMSRTRPARRLTGTALAAGLGLAMATAAPLAVHAQEVSLRASVFVPANTVFGEPCARFVEHVNQTYKGTVQIRLVGPDAVPSLEQGNAVRSGVVDLACIPPAYYTNVMPEADAAILSNLNFTQQRASGGWDALNQILHQKQGSHMIAGYGDGVQFHIFTNKPVGSIADLKSMKLRTTPNYTAFFQSLGATPVNMPPGEVQTALERGVVDGFGWPILGIFDLGWAQHTRYRVDPGFYNVIVYVLANFNKWNSLTAAQRDALVKSGEWLETENTRWAAEKGASERKRQADSGIKAVDLGAAYRKQAYDAYWAEISKRAPDAVKVLRPLLDK